MFNKSDILQDERYYIGVKLIKARPAYRINGNEIIYDLNRARNPNDVIEEGYEVIYSDNYKSFSPKDVFEKAYYMILSPNKIQEGDVLNFIKEGYSLRLGEKTTVVCDTTLTGFDIVGENLLFYMSLFIFCIPQRLPCSRIFPASGMIFLLFHSLTFPNRLFPKHANLLILLFSRNSIIFQLTCFTSRSLPENYGMVIISLL